MSTSVHARPSLAHDLEVAHARGVVAATAGLRDPALGGLRLAGTGVETLADAAVSSATPFLRAPLLSRISQALRLHPPAGLAESCPTCRVQTPCDTALALQQ